MSRPNWRRVLLVFLFAFAGVLVYVGPLGWTVGQVPAHFIGLLLAGFGVAGLFGVNIWAGGPLDPRRDPQQGPPWR